MKNTGGWLTCAALTLAVAACISDSTTDSDADTSGLTCDNVVQKWRDFVEAHNHCETDSDCRLVSDWSSCSCDPTLAGSGVGINKDAPSTRAYFDVYHSAQCADTHTSGVCDAAPADGVSCDHGRCVAQIRSCFGGGGAGTGDAGCAGDSSDTGNTSDRDGG